MIGTCYTKSKSQCPVRGSNLYRPCSRKTAPPHACVFSNSNRVLTPCRPRKGSVSVAKVGTDRGCRLIRAVSKSVAVAEKIKIGHTPRVMNNDIPELEAEELEAVDLPDVALLEGGDMPKPGEYLSARQKNGKPLGADAIYKETWLWLKRRQCENLVNPRLIESYAQNFARYIQCEDAVSTYGLLGKHPTTGGVVTSPFVQMAGHFQKAANLIWMEIYDIVKQNCTEEFSDNPNDTMEQLLRSRKGR